MVGVKWRMIDVSLIITLSSMERTDPYITGVIGEVRGLKLFP